MKEHFLQQRIDELERLLTFANTGMRNAIVEIEAGSYDEAIATLQQFVGPEPLGDANGRMP